MSARFTAAQSLGVFSGAFVMTLLVFWIVRRFAPSWEWVALAFYISGCNARLQIASSEGRIR